MLEVQKFDHLLHVAHLVREELYDRLVASDLAQLVKDLEERLHLHGHVEVLRRHRLTDVQLQEVHDRGHESLQDRVEHRRLFLIFFELKAKTEREVRRYLLV